MSNKPLDKQLYEEVKAYADSIYKKPSAYKSGFIVKEYKRRGGRYSGDKTNEGLTRWYAEEWADIGNRDYPVYRPTKRINEKTPLTVGEIDKPNLIKQIYLKQKIKGNKTLPAFKPK